MEPKLLPDDTFYIIGHEGNDIRPSRRERLSSTTRCRSAELLYRTLVILLLCIITLLLAIVVLR